MRKARLHIPLQSDAFEFSLELDSVSPVFYVNHLMTQKSEQFRQWPILKKTADTDELSIGIVAAPSCDHSIGPLTAAMRK
jgi:hypothetical protein